MCVSFDLLLPYDAMVLKSWNDVYILNDVRTFFVFYTARLMLFKLVLFSYCMLQGLHAGAQELELKISHRDANVMHQREEKVALVIILDGTSAELQPLAECIRKDLEQTHQMQVKIVCEKEPSRTEDIAQQLREGYPFALYLSMQAGESEVHSRLYNTLDVTMLQGKKWKKRNVLSVWAHHIANALWKEIIGSDSSFLSSIVYVTKDYNRAKKVRSSLIVTDWDGSRSRAIVTKPTHMLSPCWLPCEHRKDSIIIFSEFTPVNVRLMKVKSTGSIAEIVFNHQGTTVGVSPCSSENIVYCRSGVIWRYTYDALSHKSTHVPIIREKEPCACPIAMQNGDVIYCCQGKIKRWHAEDGTQEIMIKNGFCTSPAFHEARNLLIFSRRVQGNFQLICKDLDTGTEQQITHGPGNKLDPSISPCGFFAVYTLEQGKKSSIYIINLLNGLSHEISNPSDYCMCPAWSSQ